ncbi:MAG: hypothetical protein EON47_16310 [Acetobacteraceae bacterium]|nr:MAG: hypothetical protein EON47_16310 [Acetobacteraceae bacterium]
MKRLLVVSSLLALVSVAPAMAKPSCLKGAAVGAVGGHMVGSGHAVAGAAAGCAIGSHQRGNADRAAAQQQQQQQAAPQQPAR